MLLKRHVLETLTLCSCCGSLICIALSCFTNISLITGIFVPIYVIIVFIVSTTLSFKCIQWVLRLPKPIKYDVCAILRSCPYFKCIYPKTYFVEEVKKEIDREHSAHDLSVISAVLERKLVSSWYVGYISEDIAFPFACKHMLDQMIGKAFEICKKIDIRDIYIDLTSIMISHLKEYQKALKRQEKAEGSIEKHYKKTYHFENNLQSMEHCTNILRLVLKDLTPWELWETPQSELLIRILSKRLDNYIDETLGDPLWLNDKLFLLFSDEVEKNAGAGIPVSVVPEAQQSRDVETPEPVISTSITSVTPVIHTVLDNSMADTHKCDADIARSTPLDIQCSAKLREKRGRQGRSEVKIYDRIIEGSVKTWDTEVDLACISVGQDLLASLDGEVTLSRLWENDNDAESVSPNHRPRSKSPQPLWFGEEDMALDLNGVSPRPDTSPRKECSPKPKEALLKDIQSTVSHAKNKIGDLQVVVSKSSTRDEAAGMMEGLLDFGIAGLKKGLRFTGLHDDIQDKSPSHTKEKQLDRSSPEGARHKSHVDRELEINTNKDEHPVPPLTKQINVTSQDSCSGSPEPQYEDSADLMTSIARLRSLLHQTHNNTNSIPTWTCAEETRGRILTHASTRPIDTAVFADEYDMNADTISPVAIDHNTNNMQRLDKLLARTVTGVFNSIKTAVGAEGEDSAMHTAQHTPASNWTFACTSQDNTLTYSISRLVSSKRPVSVDVALDSLQHIQLQKEQMLHDTLDYDEWCWSYVPRGTGVLELCTSMGLVQSHVANRLAAILTADLLESIINAWLQELTEWMKNEMLELFKQMSKQDYASASGNNREYREFKMADTCALVMSKIPAPLYVFGEETLSKSVDLVVSSFSHKEVNKDLVYRCVDLAALHFKKSVALRNPSFDIN